MQQSSGLKLQASLWFLPWSFSVFRIFVDSLTGQDAKRLYNKSVTERQSFKVVVVLLMLWHSIIEYRSFHFSA